MSDFGVIDDSVAICKGVMLQIEPELRIIDLTHQVTPYSIPDAARFLAGVTTYYPAGTVFVTVVDPGVGSPRKAIVAKTQRMQYLVLPDNGLLTLVESQDGIESVREIKNPEWMIGKRMSSTFHGRDVFSPVAAHLAAGRDWKELGPELRQWERLNIKRVKVGSDGISGDVIGLDGPYGNLITNILEQDFLSAGYKIGDDVRVKIGTKYMTVNYAKTFSDVQLNDPLIYVDSRGRIGLAVNQGNFAATYRIHPPQPIFIYRKNGTKCGRMLHS